MSRLWAGLEVHLLAARYLGVGGVGPLNGQCRATKRDGSPCRGSATGSNGMCWAHDPENAGQRRRLASKAGKSKPNRELADLKRRLSDLADAVLLGSVDRGDAAVAGQLLNTYIRAVGVELKVREQLDLVERLEELEGLMERRNEGSRYGA